jgi:hypothetical protein
MHRVNLLEAVGTLSEWALPNSTLNLTNGSLPLVGRSFAG